MRLTAGKCFSVILLLGILISGLACTKAPDDSQLTSQIQSKLGQDSGLHDKQITVQTAGGVATLSGTVENETQREAAARYASATPGIKEVVNNLETASASATPAANQMAQAPPAAPAPQSTPPPPRKVTVPSGTSMAIRLLDPIDSEKAQPGQTFRATLDAPLPSDGDLAVPSGYDVKGHVVDVKSAGKFAGQSLLVLELDSISV